MHRNTHQIVSFVSKHINAMTCFLPVLSIGVSSCSFFVEEVHNANYTLNFGAIVRKLKVSLILHSFEFACICEVQSHETKELRECVLKKRQ